MEREIHICLNGEDRSLPKEMTLAELISFLGFNERAIAIGRNAEVVQRSEHSEIRVDSGDRIDIVHLVAGG